MDPVAIAAIVTGATQIIALAIDAYQKSGATAEQVAEMREIAMARLNAAIAAVEAAEPPAPGSGA
jgi:hypothetical protein